MGLRILPDEDKPSVAIEIPLAKPLPDYDLNDVELPTPRDVDGVLVSQGFRDLVDDARGVLLEILCKRPADFTHESSEITDIDLTPAAFYPLEITQLTGAISSDDEIYHPGLWIVLQDVKAPKDKPLPNATLEHVKQYAGELVKRLELA